MKSINPDPLTPDQAIDILHRAAAAEGAPIFKDCADVIVSLEKLRTQNEALTKEVERLKQLHITDMRVTNESADYHMKRCDSLRTQNRELREALAKIQFFPIHSEPYGVALEFQDIAKQALAQTEVKP